MWQRRLAKVQSKQDFQNLSELRLSGLLVVGTQVDVGDGVKRLLQCQTAATATATAQVTLSARIKLTQGPKFLCVINCMVKNAKKLIEEETDGFSFHENMFLNNTIPSNTFPSFLSELQYSRWPPELRLNTNCSYVRTLVYLCMIEGSSLS